MFLLFFSLKSTDVINLRKLFCILLQESCYIKWIKILTDICFLGEYIQLVSMNTVIDNKTPKMPNSVTVGTDGSVFWSDSSTSHQLHDGLYVLLANGNGRWELGNKCLLLDFTKIFDSLAVVWWVSLVTACSPFTFLAVLTDCGGVFQ